MGALELDRMTWPEVKAAQQAGHDTVVVAFGATEQHGPHLPLATDALIGDHLSRLVAERLDAFRAPTIRIGCSEHHLASRARFTGDPAQAAQAIFAAGVDAVAPNGVIGDPARATAEHGARYWDEVLSITLEAVA